MIDFSKIKTYPIKERQNKFSVKDLIPLDHSLNIQNKEIEAVADAILAAKKSSHKVILMMGGGCHQSGVFSNTHRFDGKGVY